MIDWTKPLVDRRGRAAKLVWPCAADDVHFVEIECGRWPYNHDGTPLEGYKWLGPVRNAAA